MSLRRREHLSAAVGFLVAAAALAVGAYFWGSGVEDRIVERIGIEDGRVVDRPEPVHRDPRRAPSQSQAPPGIEDSGVGEGSTDTEETRAPVDPGAEQDPVPGKGGSDDVPPPGEGGNSEGPAPVNPPGVPPGKPIAGTHALPPPPSSPQAESPVTAPDPSQRQPVREAVAPVLEGVKEGTCSLTPRLCGLLP